jgi:DNA repair protein RadC
MWNWPKKTFCKHPSGDTDPSEEGYDVTKKNKLAIGIIEGNLCDHIIVGDGYSSDFLNKP